MSADGTYIAIGDPGYDGFGRVRVFENRDDGMSQVASFCGERRFHIGETVVMTKVDQAKNIPRVFYGRVDGLGNRGVEAWEQDKTKPEISAKESVLQLSAIMALGEMERGEALEALVSQLNKAQVTDSGDNEGGVGGVVDIPAAATDALRKVLERGIVGSVTSPFSANYSYTDAGGNTQSLDVQCTMEDDVAPTFEVYVGEEQVTSGKAITIEAGGIFAGFRFENLLDQDGGTIATGNIEMMVDGILEPYSEAGLKQIKDSYPNGGYDGVLSHFDPTCVAAGEYSFTFKLADVASNSSCITAVLRVIDTQAPYVEANALDSYSNSIMFGAIVEGEGQDLDQLASSAIVKAVSENFIPTQKILETVVKDNGDLCVDLTPSVTELRPIVKRVDGKGASKEIATVKVRYKVTDNHRKHPINSLSMEKRSITLKFGIKIEDNVGPMLTTTDLPLYTPIPWDGSYQTAPPVAFKPTVIDACDANPSLSFEDSDMGVMVASGWNNFLHPPSQEDKIRRTVCRRWFATDWRDNKTELGFQRIDYIDDKAPMVKLKGEAVVVLVEGEEFVDPGVVADESEPQTNDEPGGRKLLDSLTKDTDLPRKSGDLDVVDTTESKIGVYKIAYQVYDYAGNRSDAVCRYIVIKPKPKQIHLTSLETNANVAEDIMIQLGAFTTDEFDRLDPKQDGVLHYTMSRKKARASFWFSVGHSEQIIKELGGKGVNEAIKDNLADFHFEPTDGLGPGIPNRMLPPTFQCDSGFPFGYTCLAEDSTHPRRIIPKKEAGLFNLAKACVCGREDLITPGSYPPEFYNSAIDFSGSKDAPYKLVKIPASKDVTGVGDVQGKNLSTESRIPKDGTFLFTTNGTLAPEMFNPTMKHYQAGNLQSRQVGDIYIKACMAKSFGVEGYALNELVSNEEAIYDAVGESCRNIVADYQSKMEGMGSALVLSEDEKAELADGFGLTATSTFGAELLRNLYGPQNPLLGQPRNLMEQLLKAVRNKRPETETFVGATGPTTFPDRESPELRDGFTWKGKVWIPAAFEAGDTLESVMTLTANNYQHLPGASTVSTAASEEGQTGPNGTQTLIGNGDNHLVKAAIKLRIKIHVEDDEPESEETQIDDDDLTSPPHPGRPNKTNFPGAQSIEAAAKYGEHLQTREMKIGELKVELQKRKAAAEKKGTLALGITQLEGDIITERGKLAEQMQDITAGEKEVINARLELDSHRAKRASENMEPDKQEEERLEKILETAEELFSKKIEVKGGIQNVIAELVTTGKRLEDRLAEEEEKKDAANKAVIKLLEELATLTQVSIVAALKRNLSLRKRLYQARDLQKFESDLLNKAKVAKRAIKNREGYINKLNGLIKIQEEIIKGIQESQETNTALLLGETGPDGGVEESGAAVWNDPQTQLLNDKKYNEAITEKTELQGRLVDPTNVLNALKEAEKLNKLALLAITGFFNNRSELNSQLTDQDLYDQIKSMQPGLEKPHEGLLLPTEMAVLKAPVEEFPTLLGTQKIEENDAGGAFGEYLRDRNSRPEFDYPEQDEDVAGGTTVQPVPNHIWDGGDEYSEVVTGVGTAYDAVNRH